MNGRGSPMIVVGLDGSPGSRRALAWALEEAESRGGWVEVVTSFSAERGGDHLTRADAARLQADAEAETASSRRRPVSFQIVEGEPADVLTHLSERARFVVLGSHGVSALRHSAAGSVSDTVARMAQCPVVIMPRGAPAPPPHDEVAVTP